MVTNELSGNIVDLCPVGALNNLPYNFVARPWELKSNYTADAADSLGANIDCQSRGSELLRILPRVNDEVNEEWITDKTRHSFDGLKRQRLTIPLVKKPDGGYKELKWEEAIVIARDKIAEAGSDGMGGIVGNFMDLESLCAFRDLMHRLNCENIDISSGAPKLSADFRTSYLFNSKITGIDETDMIILVGCNPRSENPVLNARIRKAVDQHGVQVAVVGSAPDLTYDYVHLGNTTASLEQLADGTSPFCE